MTRLQKNEHNIQLGKHPKATLASVASVMIAAIYFINPFGSLAPISDDISMIAYSLEWSRDWFTKGLADYFIVYPEYYDPQSNFIRPISNFSYWIFHFIFPADSPFHANHMQLLVLNYGILLAIALLLYSEIRIASRSIGLGICAGLFAIAIPTFWTTPSPTYTSFVFDEFATLFCLLAFRFVRQDHVIAAAISLTAALLTKEIAFPIILAFGCFFILKRNQSALAALIAGVSVWAILRYRAFGLDAAGVYVFSDEPIDFVAWIITKIQNIFTLPLGPVFYDEITKLENWPEAILTRSGFLFVLNSMFLFSILAWVSVRLIKFKPSLASSEWQNPSLITLSAMCSFLAFGFVAYVGANYRYAFVLLPFLLIFLAQAIRQPIFRFCVFFIFSLGSFIASAPSVQSRLHENALESYRYEIMRGLISHLQHRDQSRAVVVLADAVTGYANPEALKIITKHAARIIRGTSIYIEGCKKEELINIQSKLITNFESARLTTTLPDCARFIFESSPKIGEFVSGNMILRNDDIHYELPQDPRRSSGFPNGYWLGQELTTHVSRSSGLDLLYYDFGRGRWVEEKI